MAICPTIKLNVPISLLFQVGIISETEAEVFGKYFWKSPLLGLTQLGGFTHRPSHIFLYSFPAKRNADVITEVPGAILDHEVLENGNYILRLEEQKTEREQSLDDFVWLLHQ
jgi:hypothetical protein